MAKLSEFGDADALENRYVDKVIVYVEGDGDQRLFTNVVGPDVADRLEFKTPAESTGGCGFVVARVKAERQSNEKIFGLVDGETAASHGGTDALLECRRLMFALPGEPGLDGVFFLSAHEVENLILLYGGIYELIPKNVRLASQGEFDGAQVRESVLKLTKRFFVAALLKYASLHVAAVGGPMITVKGGKFVDNPPSTTALLLELKARVKAEGGDWEVYRDEMRRIIKALRLQFRAEALSAEARADHFIRLTDGKNLLLGLRKIYKQAPHDALLADALTQPPYSDRFRTELLELTQAA